MSRRILGIALCLALLPYAGTNAFAADPDHATALNKLSRGALNTALGWMEVPYRITERDRSDQPVYSFVHGFLYGIGMATVRTLYGLWDLVTFPLPPYDGPTLDPETLTQVHRD